jgi:hypothetical protein
MTDETNAYAVKINGCTFLALEAVKSIVDEARLDGWNMALEEAAKVCERRYMGDNNREDMEVRRCAAAIRALIPKEDK